MEHLTELGVGGIITLLVLKEVFAFVSKKRNGNIDFLKLARKIEDLWEWHNVTDPATGGKIWYVQQSLEKAIEKLANNVELQTQILQRMASDNVASHDRIESALNRQPTQRVKT